jgi:glycosyltransferase involved in cell wall biosynthesis
MVKKGHEVIVICQANQKASWFKAFTYVWGEEINGVGIIRIACPNRYMFTFSVLSWVIRKAKDVDVIHTSTYTGAFPVWLASKICRKPCVITVHEVLGTRWKKFGFKNAWLLELLEKVILKLGFSKYVGVSYSTTTQIGRLGKKSDVIYNGVDYEHWNPDKYQPIRLHNGFTYLYFGRAGITKGIENLIMAADIINDRIPNSKLIMILGKEPDDERKKIVDMIDKWGLNDHIILMNSVKYEVLPRYIKGVDCVVVPSLSEGFGFSCAEACAMGVPVVASNVDSLPEVISGVHRLVKDDTEHQNYVNLAMDIMKIEMGIAETSPLKKFEWKDCIDKYENVYKELVN